MHSESTSIVGFTESLLQKIGTVTKSLLEEKIKTVTKNLLHLGVSLRAYFNYTSMLDKDSN